MIKKLRDKSKNKKGFTMVELIVVVVIILILAAVMVPQLLKYVDKAKQANAKADAATILSQAQADFADAQLTNTPYPAAGTTPTKVGDVTIITGNTAAANQAAITITSTAAADTTKYKEITKFVYNSGDYTVTWENNKWTIAENTTP